MKENEIQIGDWVRWEYGELVKDFRVDSLIRDHTLEIGVYSDRGFMGYADQIEPIPLTAEILEKNGFKRAKYGYEWKERLGGYMGQTTSSTTPIEIMYDEGHCVVSNPHIGRMFQGSIDSVNELQHALRLCGIEKEITL